MAVGKLYVMAFHIIYLLPETTRQFCIVTRISVDIISNSDFDVSILYIMDINSIKYKSILTINIYCYLMHYLNHIFMVQVNSSSDINERVAIGTVIIFIHLLTTQFRVISIISIVIWPPCSDWGKL